MTLANRGVTTHVMLLDHAQDKWFLANDDKVCIGNTVIQSPRVYTRPTIIQVTQVNMSQVLAQDPHMLLYEICGNLEKVPLSMIHRYKQAKCTAC